MKNSLLTLLALCCINFGFGQTTETDTTKSEQLFVITKNDGTEYIGKILSDDGREVLIDTETLGKIYIPKSDIKSIIKVQDQKSIVYGEFRDLGPFTTRYSFTTNALPIVKGENYALINLYGPEVHFAVTDHFNIGIMSTWGASPMVLAMKYSVKGKNEKINFSLGTLMGTTGYLNAFRGFGGLHFANVTYGSRGSNITVSAGFAYLKTGSYSYYPDEGTYTSTSPYYYGLTSRHQTPMAYGPIFSVAGITQVGAKASLVFDSMVGIFSDETRSVQTTTITPESWNPNPPYEYIPGSYIHTISATRRVTTALFLMPGMRFQGKENMAFQVSLAGVSVFRGKGYTYNNSFSFPFPMCTWFFKF